MPLQTTLVVVKVRLEVVVVVVVVLRVDVVVAVVVLEVTVVATHVPHNKGHCCRNDGAFRQNVSIRLGDRCTRSAH